MNRVPACTRVCRSQACRGEVVRCCKTLARDCGLTRIRGVLARSGEGRRDLRTGSEAGSYSWARGTSVVPSRRRARAPRADKDAKAWPGWCSVGMLCSVGAVGWILRDAAVALLPVAGRVGVGGLAATRDSPSSCVALLRGRGVPCPGCGLPRRRVEEMRRVGQHGGSVVLRCVDELRCVIVLFCFVLVVCFLCFVRLSCSRSRSCSLLPTPPRCF